MAISLMRIDDRLIHGQVVLGWTKMLNATVIVVPDDAAAADRMQVTMMKAATPIGVRSSIVSIADGAALLKDPKLNKEKVIVVVRGPGSAVALINAGVDIKKITIGNMRGETGKKRVSKEVAVNEEEWNHFKTLDSKGIDLVVQWLPGGDTKNLNDTLKKQDFKNL